MSFYGGLVKVDCQNNCRVTLTCCCCSFRTQAAICGAFETIFSILWLSLAVFLGCQYLVTTSIDIIHWQILTYLTLPSIFIDQEEYETAMKVFLILGIIFGVPIALFWIGFFVVNKCNTGNIQWIYLNITFVCLFQKQKNDLFFLLFKLVIIVRTFFFFACIFTLAPPVIFLALFLIGKCVLARGGKFL